MSDIVERLTALSEEYRDHDPDVVAFTAEAAAELTRLRAENERTKALLARVTDDVARYNDEARKARADLAAAQERERALREALEEIDAVAVDHGHYETAARTMHEIARAAMRGEP